MKLGNIALRLEANQAGPSLLPQPKTTYSHPTFDQTAKVSLIGKVFYEIHPQLWGQGLMSEAFGETLRFAFEEVGCTVVEASCIHRPLLSPCLAIVTDLYARRTRPARIWPRSKYALNTG
jgi:hypothetical protein